MIYPTRRMVLIAAAVAPLALLVGLVLPAMWTAGLALLVLLAALALVDAAAGVRPGSVRVEVAGPGAVGVGQEFAVEASLRFAGAAPARAEVALDLAGPVEAVAGHRATAGPDGAAVFPLRAERRGTARLHGLWVRWPGLLGLVFKQKRLALGEDVAITPDVRPLREGARFASREALHGLAAQLTTGEGAEFDSLVEFRPGMDRRAIDWKQSARHTALIAKEYRTERNNQIVVAVDSGRMMCEPAGGVPRVDRAVSAALLTAFVALKDGDRVGLFSFDARPRAAVRPVSGARAFATLQRVAAGIDYSADETNYTLALATLAQGLQRRTLIVVFTEFADTASAELMLSAVGSLLARHLVLFVVLRDEELEAMAAAEPHEADDVSRAVVAGSLLEQRRLVIARLRHLGVHVVEAAPDEAGPALVNAYVSIKRRNLL